MGAVQEEQKAAVGAGLAVAIIAAAGGAEIPSAWLEQLAIGGRLVAPTQGSSVGQVLVVVDRHSDGWSRIHHESVHFVPLKSGVT